MGKHVIFACLILFCLPLIFTACQSEANFEKSMDSVEGIEQFEPQQAPEEDRNPEEPKLPRQLIRTGDIEFTVLNLDSAYKRIHQDVAKVDGFVANETLETYRGYRAYRLTVRVKPEKFESLIAQILNGSESLAHKRIETQDVSQRYYDLESRLSSKKALEKRYLQLLTQAKTVEDILKIEAEAAQLREDIEAMEGNFRLLKNQIGLSTLSVYFYETQASLQPGILSRIAENFTNGWTGFIDSMIGLINVWPLLILLGFGIWAFRRYRRRRKG